MAKNEYAYHRAQRIRRNLDTSVVIHTEDCMKTSVKVFLALSMVLAAISVASLPNPENSTASSLPNNATLTAATLDAPAIKASIGGYTLYLPIVIRRSGPIYIPLVAKAVAPTSAPTPIPNPVKNGGFEQANDGTNGPWFASLTYIGQPVQGVDVRDTLAGTGASPHTGSYAAWLGGFPDAQIDLLQQITIPTSGTTLRYWAWIQSDEPICDRDNLDGAWVFFLTSQQNLVESYALCTSARTNGWVKREVNLSSYAGQTGWLTFSVRILGANSNLFIDDVALGTLTNASLPGQTPIPAGSRTPTP
jgi:hypothetical protein